MVGAGAGAGAAVAAVAVHAGGTLVQPSWARRHDDRRWLAYLLAGAVTSAVVGAWVVVVLIACGLVELTARRVAIRRASGEHFAVGAVVAAGTASAGVLSQVAWVAFKVGALSYGGGFVIIPLMQHDAVDRYHWLSPGQFLNAVALGQITPGPVVLTVAAVGFGAAGLAGGLLAATIAFAPSFLFVLIGARHFDRIRGDERASAFLGGAGPAAIGAIFGAAVPLAMALSEAWQYAVLAGAAILLVLLHRSTVFVLLAAGAVGLVIAVAGGPMPG